MTKFLNVGGLLFVEVPCLDQDYKKQHEPHVSFFSKVALETLAARAKFTDVKVSFHGDTLSDIKKYDFSRSVIIKLLNISGLDLILPFGPNKDQVAEFELTRLQQAASFVSLTTVCGTDAAITLAQNDCKKRINSR
jgi:hypothetical protein